MCKVLTKLTQEQKEGRNRFFLNTTVTSYIQYGKVSASFSVCAWTGGCVQVDFFLLLFVSMELRAKWIVPLSCVTACSIDPPGPRISKLSSPREANRRFCRLSMALKHELPAALFRSSKRSGSVVYALETNRDVEVYCRDGGTVE